MKHTLTIVLLATFVLTLVACNNGHLSRSQAKSQLETLARQTQQRNSDGSHDLLVRVGKVANCDPSSYSKEYDPVESDVTTAVLSATGYLAVRPVKKHVWSVELTERGNHSITGEKYGHEQNGECDEWQVTVPLSRYDHLDVTGILEDGVHAKVDASLIFIITPVGLAVRKVAPTLMLEIDKKAYGEKLANDFLSGRLTSLLGDDLIYTPPDKDRYVKQVTFTFDKYDDGWKISTKGK